jgi:hypothetical protein
MSGVIELKKMAERALGVTLTCKQVPSLWLECRVNLGQRKLRDTIKVVEASESARLDTREREWPCYGDGLEQAQAFYQKLNAALQEREYTRA